MAGRALAGLLAAGIFLFAVPMASAQKGASKPPELAQPSKPSQDDGRQILDQFRSQGILGDYFLQFELRVLPRNGDERVISGRMWGTRNAAGPLSRVSVFAPTGAGVREVRLLVQGGPQPKLWRWQDGGAAELLGTEALFQPVAGTDLTPFDLQMPFLYWPDSAYEGLVRMNGRPTHRFLFKPPAAVAERCPALRGVRAFLDTQYTALVQAEYLGASGSSIKAVSLLDLKKVGEQWIVKSLDLRDETTRNKTRFLVTAAAINQRFDESVFDSARLAEEAPVPPNATSLGAK